MVGPKPAGPNAAAIDTWLLTGIPRSGSSLACRLAGEVPDVVALSEPISPSVFEGVVDPDEARTRIEGFVVQARAGIVAERRAPSLHVQGRLDDNVVAVEADGGLRRRQARPGEIEVDKPLSARFTLLVKHNALFAALLPVLAPAFPCLALVRNPLAVLASWQTVDLPVHRGRIPAGEQFDPRLRAALDREPDPLARQAVVLDWFFTRYAESLASERILRYEDLIATGGAVLHALLGDAPRDPESLASRNAHDVYASAPVDALLAALDPVGAWTRFYTRAECEQAADAIRSGRSS